ncbi:MAG: ABC transporter ATP-binding protein [Tissierellia bacterium]|nr:ABC transporter ATP-binding protein [Tissierellia bacterium]
MSKKGNRLFKLLYLVRPLLPVMIVAILFGSLGFVFGTKLLIYPFELISQSAQGLNIGIYTLILLVLIALARGVFRYLEQLSNHYIAFKILEIIRNNVFEHMRKLAPAKLENQDKGNLINVLTSDIEAIEVFYAHTISPILIAIVTSVIYILWIASYSAIISLAALLSYLFIGISIPVFAYKRDAIKGRKARDEFGSFNSYILDTLRGRKELIQFRAVKSRMSSVSEREDKLYELNMDLRRREGKTMGITDLSLIAFTALSLVLSIVELKSGKLTFINFFLPTLLLYNSFGPVLALSALSNNMFTTISSIGRVLDVLEEEPVIEENLDGKEFTFNDLKIENLFFNYEDEEVLKDISFEVKERDIFSIEGKSGSGKSTLLKLIMNFWKVDHGKILFNGINIDDIKTASLRKNISYVTQDTYIFAGTIEENLKIAKQGANIDEIIKACMQADIHEFIMSLPHGYQTYIGRNNNLSAGQRQRIGIARAFLHDAKLILLDEPTSNLDILSEGEILKVLSNMKRDKTLIIVSHRKSTHSIVDKSYKLERGIIS